MIDTQNVIVHYKISQMLKGMTIKKNCRQNRVKDLFADFTGRKSMANNRSFTPFRMTNGVLLQKPQREVLPLLKLIL